MNLYFSKYKMPRVHHYSFIVAFGLLITHFQADPEKSEHIDHHSQILWQKL